MQGGREVFRQIAVSGGSFDRAAAAFGLILEKGGKKQGNPSVFVEFYGEMGYSQIRHNSRCLPAGIAERKTAGRVLEKTG